MAKELWDVRKKNGELTGKTMVRGEPCPDGFCHAIVWLLVVSDEGKVLITRRAPEKKNAGKWESTSGSVLAGETPLGGALRELLEETGIRVTKEQVTFIANHDFGSGLFYGYVVRVHGNEKIVLQPGETSEYRWMPYSDYLKLIRTPLFSPRIADVYALHAEKFERAAFRKN